MTSDEMSSRQGEEEVVPVVQEELEVQKQRVETGRVRLNKRVREQEAVVEEAVVQEEVEIEHVPVGRFVEQPVAVRYEGEALIIPVHEEVPVIEKRIRLKEEIRITKRRIETSQRRPVRLRTEAVMIERVEPSSASEVSKSADEHKTV